MMNEQNSWNWPGLITFAIWAFILMIGGIQYLFLDESKPLAPAKEEFSFQRPASFEEQSKEIRRVVKERAESPDMEPAISTPVPLQAASAATPPRAKSTETAIPKIQ